jgi:hypothetical protein
MLPKDYLFSPAVLKAREDAKPAGRKTLEYYPQGVAPDSTAVRGMTTNVFTDYTGMYQNYMFNVTEAAKSFNYYKPMTRQMRPAFIEEYYNEGGDIVDKLEQYYDVEDGFNVAGAIMMDEAAATKKKSRRK